MLLFVVSLVLGKGQENQAAETLCMYSRAPLSTAICLRQPTLTSPQNYQGLCWLGPGQALLYLLGPARGVGFLNSIPFRDQMHIPSGFYCEEDSTHVRELLLEPEACFLDLGWGKSLVF